MFSSTRATLGHTVVCSLECKILSIGRLPDPRFLYSYTSNAPSRGGFSWSSRMVGFCFDLSMVTYLILQSISVEIGLSITETVGYCSLMAPMRLCAYSLYFSSSCLVENLCASQLVLN